MPRNWRTQRVWLATAALVATASDALAQRSLGFAVGRASVRQYNQQASPLNYDGSVAAFSLGFFAESQRNSWAVQLDVDGGDLFPKAAALGSGAFVANLRLSIPFLREIAGARGRSARVGLAAVGDVLFRDHRYGTGSGSEPYADAFAGLDAATRASLSGTRTRISLAVAVPVLRVAWRTPYAGLKYAPSGELALPSRYRGVQGEFIAEYLPAGRWSWTAGLRVSAMSDRGAWALEHGGRRLALGLRRRVGGAQ